MVALNHNARFLHFFQCASAKVEFDPHEAGKQLRRPNLFDLMLDHPFEPCFVFFGNFDFHGVGTVKRRDDSNDALVVKTSSVFHP